MKIPFLDIQHINSRNKEEFLEIFSNLLDEGSFIYGKNYEEFIDDFKSYIGVDYSIGVGNGYDALNIIFKALILTGRLKKGDEIIVPSNSFIASALPILQNDLTPIFIQPDETNNIDFQKFELKVTKNTKACLIVHLYGQTCWSEKFESFCRKNEIIIIEDCAQSIGSKFKNKKTGNLGIAGAFSFYPGKNLGALGDAGAITTNNYEIYNCCRKLANYGSDKKYIHNSIGFNSRLDDFQAAILKFKLKLLDSENARRIAIARRYLIEIKNEFIQLPIIKNDHVFHLFVIKCVHRDSLIEYLFSKNIQTLIHYPLAIPNQLAFKDHHQFKKLSNKHHEEILSLPISPVMSEKQVDYLIETINQFNV